MHWPAIDADGESRRANEPDELKKSGLIRQIDTVIWRRDPPRCFSGENYANGRKRSAKVLDYGIAQ
jgi:hypothetical protein